MLTPLKRLNGGLVYALLLSALVIALAVPEAFAADRNDQAIDDKEMPVTIHPYVEVMDDHILLADIFDPAGKFADRVVARAPQPGEEMVLPAMWLWKAAKTFGVDWKPASVADTITVTRPAATIGADALRGILMEGYFQRTGEDDLVELEVGGASPAIHLPLTASPTARLDRFELDNQSGRFTATIVAPAEGRALERLTLAGRFHRVVEMPVPTSRLGRGHIIRDGDIEMVRLRDERLASNLVVDPAQLIGQSVKRALPAGQPIRDGAVEAPIIVEKGRIVTVFLETDSMVLTVQARAMEPGALGEVIRVQNTNSNTVFQAEVGEDGTVRVALNNAPS